MRILHAPTEIAGQVGLTAYGQREIGDDARTFFPPHPFGYEHGPDYRLRSERPALQALELLARIPAWAARFDVFHFHYAHSLTGRRTNHLDAVALRRLGRTVATEFWGGEARLGSVERARNKWWVNAYDEDERQNRELLARWAEITGGHVVISDHYFDVFLRDYFEHVHVVGQRVDARAFTPRYPDPERRVPVVVHAPSNPRYKGTEFVRAAVERLSARGLRFEYREIVGTSHAAARHEYADADLVVDQLRGGSHGVFAVEALALGKPVICYVLPELVPTFPEGFPIINADPDTIEDVLAEWLERPEDRHALGRQGREYAERVHDCRVVAGRLADAYRAMGAGR